METPADVAVQRSIDFPADSLDRYKRTELAAVIKAREKSFLFCFRCCAR
jgi:hypothetical protein